MHLPVRLSALQQQFPELVNALHGKDNHIERVFCVEESQANDLIFVGDKAYIEAALSSPARSFVTTQALSEQLIKKPGAGVLITQNVKLAHALIKQAYGDRDYRDQQWFDGKPEPRIHSSAVVHKSASIGEGSVISPHVCIAENVVIGKNCRIMPGAVIEEDAKIGDNCLIQPNVVIGYRCILKNNVEIGAGSVIGSEGFGFAQDPQRKSHRIPQTGIVIIAENARIGANNCLDRATYQTTTIGAGTKTDNLCHFAHNVEIGEDCLLTSLFCIAGSSKVGDRVIASGQTGIIDHVSIASDSVLLHRAGVTKDITEPGMYAGLPLQPLGQYMKNSAQIKKLTELSRKVKNLKQ